MKPAVMLPVAFGCVPARFASSFTTQKPMLWRWRAYPSPGFPSPTTSQSAANRGPPPNTFFSRSAMETTLCHRAISCKSLR